MIYSILIKNKTYLAVSFVADVASGFNKEEAQEKLLNILGFPKARNFNSDYLQQNYPDYQEDSNKMIFSINDVQRINDFTHSLSLKELQKMERNPSRTTLNISQTMWKQDKHNTEKEVGEKSENKTPRV